MKFIEINGGKRLQGSVKISGAKNISVAILPALILNKGKTRLYNVPNIDDIKSLIEILKYLECNVIFKNSILEVDASKCKCKPLTIDAVSKLRGSYYFLGAMLSRFGAVRINTPGGCKLGERPIDYHIDSMRKLGYVVHEGEIIDAFKNSEFKEKVKLDCKKSVGTTINSLLASFNRKKKVVIYNPAFEFETFEVMKFLVLLGLNVHVYKDKIVVKPSKITSNDLMFRVEFDRMEAITYMALGALCGDIKLIGIIPKVLSVPLVYLKEFGASIEQGQNYVRVTSQYFHGGLDIKTDYYPGFPTDAQQVFTALLAAGQKESCITETIYEKRISQLPELAKMGVNYGVSNNVITIKNSTIKPAEVAGKDLRGTAALVIAALKANGTSKVYGVEHLLRGYDSIISKIKTLGADITLHGGNK